MKESWRWFGPKDPITIDDIRQTGASAVVTALHHIPNGEAWSEEEIIKHKNLVEGNNSGLVWEVVESVPVHEAIKQGLPEREQYIENYIISLKNLAKHGIHTVIYNFMPVLDWTRTDLSMSLNEGGVALAFDEVALAAFDCYILRRENAFDDYQDNIIEQAKTYFENLTPDAKTRLTKTLIAGLPGAEEHFTLEQFKQALSAYDDIDEQQLRENLSYFLERICPVAESVDIKLAIHPDDPPFALFGLPRIISVLADYEWLFTINSSPANGMTLCAGSLGSRKDNDLVEIVRKFGDKIYFTHLRNVKLDKDSRSFYEAPHLSGSTNMYDLVKALLQEEQRRRTQNIKPCDIPMRPDHGTQLLDDLHKTTNPGYSCIGRLKGLAEMRGLIYALEHDYA